MSRHVSVEILALYREGAVSAAEAARIEGHLAVCARCSGTDAALTGLTSVLAATELPPMPESLTIRIQTAITRESAARAAAGSASATRAPADGARATSSAGPVAAGTGGADSIAGDGVRPGADSAPDGTDETGSAQIPGRPDLPERPSGRSRRFRMPDWSSPSLLRGLAAAAAVVVIAGGGILLANARTASQKSGAGNTSAGAPPAQPSGVRGHGGPVSFGAAGGPVTVSYRMKDRMATATAVASHANFTTESLPAMVREQVANLTGVATGAGVTTPNSQGPASQRSRIGSVRISTLEGCLSGMAARHGRQVLLADVARFLGRRATIVVMKSPSAPDVLYVGIVGLSCSESGLDIIQTFTVPVR